jgi:lysozyme family protein
MVKRIPPYAFAVAASKPVATLQRMLAGTVERGGLIGAKNLSPLHNRIAPLLIPDA